MKSCKKPMTKLHFSFYYSFIAVNTVNEVLFKEIVFFFFLLSKHRCYYVTTRSFESKHYRCTYYVNLILVNFVNENIFAVSYTHLTLPTILLV